MPPSKIMLEKKKKFKYPGPNIHDVFFILRSVDFIDGSRMCEEWNQLSK